MELTYYCDGEVAECHIASGVHEGKGDIGVPKLEDGRICMGSNWLDWCAVIIGALWCIETNNSLCHTLISSLADIFRAVGNLRQQIIYCQQQRDWAVKHVPSKS